MLARMFTPPGGYGGQSEALQQPLCRASLPLSFSLSSLFSPADNAELQWPPQPFEAPCIPLVATDDVYAASNSFPSFSLFIFLSLFLLPSSSLFFFVDSH